MVHNGFIFSLNKSYCTAFIKWKHKQLKEAFVSVVWHWIWGVSYVWHCSRKPMNSNFFPNRKPTGVIKEIIKIFDQFTESLMLLVLISSYFPSTFSSVSSTLPEILLYCLWNWNRVHKFVWMFWWYQHRPKWGASSSPLQHTSSKCVEGVKIKVPPRSHTAAGAFPTLWDKLCSKSGNCLFTHCL